MHGTETIESSAGVDTADSTEPLLSVRGLCKRFPIRKGLFGKTVGHVHAVEDFNLDLYPGESIGLVGESGCGKTTAGRSIMRLIEPTAGSIQFRGTDLMELSPSALREQRRHMQMIFQDPYGSLNPRMNVAQILTEPLMAHGIMNARDARDEAARLLARVDLPASHLERFPHEFSGGQRQRIGIARALSLKPDMIVCDEAVSALDVSVQAQVINLLSDLQQEFGMSYIFIAHDLAVVAHLCHRVAVMYLGEIVEIGPSEAIYNNPVHPYTQALLSAIPADEPGQRRQRIVLRGLTKPLNPPSAARMAKRFSKHAAAFASDPLTLQEVEPGHFVRRRS